MNRVFVLKEKEKVEDRDWAKCYTGMHSSAYWIDGEWNIFPESHDARNYIESFLRGFSFVSSQEELLESFISYLEEVNFEEIKEIKEKIEEKEEIIENRFDLLDL